MPGFAYGPWIPDVDDLNSTTAPVASGCLPTSRGWGPWPSLAAISAAVGGVVRGAFMARTSSGSAVAFCGTADKLWKLSGSTWTDMSRLAGGAYNLPADNYWTFDQQDKYLYAVQAGDVPQVIDIDAGTNFAALGGAVGEGTPPTARYCKSVGGFLFLMDLTAPVGSIQPTTGRIQFAWSGYRNPAFWKYGERSSDTGTLPSGGFIMGMSSPETGLLIQQNAVNRFVRVNDRRVWDFAVVEASQGTRSPYSIVEHQGVVYYYGVDGWIASNAGGLSTEGGIEVVDEWFKANSNPARLGTILGALDPTRPRIMWLFASQGNSSYTLDHIIGFDVQLKRFFHGPVNATTIFKAATSGTTLEGLGAAGLGFAMDDPTPPATASDTSALFAQAALNLNLTSPATASSLTTVRATPPLAYAESVAGVWTSFPPSIPRITDKGLLVEEARTNSIRNNSMTGAVAGTPGTLPTNWSETSVPTGLTRTISLTTINGIDVIDINYAGTTTSTAQLQIRPDNPANALATNGQVWTGSMFLSTPRDTGITNLVLAIWMYSSAPAFLGASANYSAFADRANFNRKIMPAFTIDQATTASITFPIATNSITSGTPVDITLRIGWPQLELGAFVTSPIRTTTVAVTRAADAVRVAAIPWFNAGEGTLFTEGSVYLPASGGNKFMSRFSDNSYNNSIVINVGSTGFPAFATAGSAAFDGNASPGSIAVANTTFKVAGVYKVNDLAASMNGGAVATDVAFTMPTGITRFDLGADHGAVNNMNGYIRRISYWNTRLTNAQLQELTSPPLKVPYSLDSDVWQGGVPQIGGFDAAQKLGFFSGLPMEALLRTGRIELIPGLRCYVNGWRPQTDAATVKGRTAMAETPQQPATFSASAPTPLNPWGVIEEQVTGRVMQFEATVPAGTAWTSILGGEFDDDMVKPDGRA